MQAADTLIEARWIIPVEPANQILEQHTLVILDGKILDILPTPTARNRYSSQNLHHLSDHLLIPGLINAHTHAAMNLMKGLADDLPLMRWLQQHIWPAEANLVNPEFVRDGSELAMAEMIRGGTTCFNDMYFFPDVTAQVAAQAGMRAVIGLIVLDFPTQWATKADDYLQKGLDLAAVWQGHPLINSSWAPHAPYTVSDNPLTQIRDLSAADGRTIHMHIHETADEIAQAVTDTGKRPLARLDDLGLLSPRLNAVHMTQLIPDEITRLADTGVSVTHCPQSNLKLASGFCPINDLMKKHINVALGTDGAASNNDLDLLNEMQTAALLAKGLSRDATAVNLFQALSMATLNGAKALGIANKTGSLLKGKAADITAVNLNCVETQPLYQPLSQLLYASNRSQVTDVWVNGQQLLKERHLTTLDKTQCLHKAKHWQKRISQHEHTTTQL
jgi:5-methylthioadenosine/S-adenosylhomocysteine deaminase